MTPWATDDAPSFGAADSSRSRRCPQAVGWAERESERRMRRLLPFQLFYSPLLDSFLPSFPTSIPIRSTFSAALSTVYPGFCSFLSSFAPLIWSNPLPFVRSRLNRGADSLFLSKHCGTSQARFSFYAFCPLILLNKVEWFRPINSLQN